MEVYLLKQETIRSLDMSVKNWQPCVEVECLDLYVDLSLFKQGFQTNKLYGFYSIVLFMQFVLCIIILARTEYTRVPN